MFQQSEKFGNDTTSFLGANIANLFKAGGAVPILFGVAILIGVLVMLGLYKGRGS